MPPEITPDDFLRAAASRQSKTGAHLTEAVFDKTWMSAAVIERQIRHNGEYKTLLNDLSETLAKQDSSSPVAFEVTIREQFKARYEQSMHQMQERLVSRQADLGEADRNQAYVCALETGFTVRESNHRTFEQAVDVQAMILAKSLDITETGARQAMWQSFATRESRDFHKWGVDLETENFRPDPENSRWRDDNRQNPEKPEPTHSMANGQAETARPRVTTRSRG